MTEHAHYPSVIYSYRQASKEAMAFVKHESTNAKNPINRACRLLPFEKLLVGDAFWMEEATNHRSIFWRLPQSVKKYNDKHPDMFVVIERVNDDGLRSMEIARVK